MSYYHSSPRSHQQKKKKHPLPSHKKAEVKLMPVRHQPLSSKSHTETRILKSNCKLAREYIYSPALTTHHEALPHVYPTHAASLQTSLNLSTNHRTTDRLRLEHTPGVLVVQPPCSKQGHPETAALGHSQTAFEQLKGGILTTCLSSVASIQPPPSKGAIRPASTAGQSPARYGC